MCLSLCLTRIFAERPARCRWATVPQPLLCGLQNIGLRPDHSPGRFDQKALCLLRRLLCMAVSHICRHPENGARRTFSLETNFLFACLAHCSPKNCFVKELQLFFFPPGITNKTFVTFSVHRAATMIRSLWGRCPPRSVPALFHVSDLGHLNFCCIKMTKIVETINWLESWKYLR